jgi:hypothetical protein
MFKFKKNLENGAKFNELGTRQPKKFERGFYKILFDIRINKTQNTPIAKTLFFSC